MVKLRHGQLGTVSAHEEGISLSTIASRFRILPSKCTVLFRGKRVVSDDQLRQLLAQEGPESVLFILGVPEEDPTGCEPAHIEMVMRQARVDRNAAIRALRACGQDPTSAILSL